jgi:FkbM family methyltransferase
MEKQVFDLGMYDASDTSYFLEEGFHVIAVEANPALVARAQNTLPTYLSSGQLQIVHAAVGATETSVELNVCGDDLGSSSILETKVASRNPFGRVTVPGITLQRLHSAIWRPSLS